MFVYVVIKYKSWLKFVVIAHGTALRFKAWGL